MPRELRGFSTVKGDRDIKQIEKTSGWNIHYADGTVEMDLNMGGSSFILGYNNYNIMDNVEKQMMKVARSQSNNGHWTEATERAGQILCQDLWDTYTWALSGTSAVEAAISMSDEYWKALGKNRPKIISFSFAWHGTSYLTKDMGAPFLLQNHTDRCINFPHPKNRQDEIETVRKILFETSLMDVGCIIFDSATWINGLHPWSEKWWRDIRDICDSYGILMITDDVASCWGKAKAFHPFTTIGYGIQPDISAVGKSLTAGYAPLGAALCNKKVGDVISQPGVWNYNHTWQPSMMGIYLMLNTYDEIVSNQYMSPRHLDYIESNLKKLGNKLQWHGIIDSYRVSGLFLSLDAKKDTKSTGLSSTFLKKNIRVCAPLIANQRYFEDLEKAVYGSCA